MGVTFDCYTWLRQDKGWYTHELLGSIHMGHGGKWLWYPPESDDIIGPFDTLREAKEVAESGITRTEPPTACPKC